MYAKLEETVAAPPPIGTGQVEIDGDDVGFGFDVGALFEFSEHTRMGIVYLSKQEPTFGGDVKISPVGIETGIDASVTFPQSIRASIYHDLNAQWALLGSAGWENWSDFENITISTSRGSNILPRNWDDTWYVSAGVHYRISEPWLLQLGFKYDSSPVDAEDRTPDMPIDRQIRIATGVQYQWSERLSIGGQFTYANFGEAEIDNDLLKGKYDRNQALFFALNFNWKF